MKNYIVFILIFILSLPAAAQQGLFEELTQKYSSTAGFSASQITSDMFDLYIKKKNIDENSPVYEALNNLDRILVISQNNFSAQLTSNNGENSNNVPSAIQNTILDYYKSNDYMLFKTENRMGENLKVYLKKNGENINSLALVTHSPTSVNLVELHGDIDLSTVSELSKAMNLKGLENLYKINNTGWSVSAPYPPQPPMTQEEIEQMLTHQRKQIEKQHTLTRKQQEQIEKQARVMAEQQREMARQHREMAEKYQRQPIILSSPGDANTEYYIDGKKVSAEDIKKLEPGNIEKIEVNKSDSPDKKNFIRIRTK